MGACRLIWPTIIRRCKELEDFARLWHRESLLLPLALYLDTTELDAEGANGNVLFTVQQFLARSDGLFLLDTREIWSGLGLPHVILDIHKPTPEEQIAAWEAVLPVGSPGLVAHLTAQFNLNLPTIQQIGQTTLAEYVRQAQYKESKNGAHPLPPLSERLWQACLAYTRPHLDRLAQRITTRFPTCVFHCSPTSQTWQNGIPRRSDDTCPATTGAVIAMGSFVFRPGDCADEDTLVVGAADCSI